MSDKLRKVRIVSRENRLPPIEDALAFKKNASSEIARKVNTVIRHTNIDIWFDKHSHNRQQHGDDNGKREGIDNDIVENLVKRGLRLLLFYSNIVSGFSFLNGLGITHVRRIVLKEALGERMLNIVIEVHMLGLR